MTTWVTGDTGLPVQREPSGYSAWAAAYSFTSRRTIERSELAALFHVWATVLKRTYFGGSSIKVLLNDSVGHTAMCTSDSP